MSDFRRLGDRMLVSPQISLADVTEAKRLGVTTIVNNRPDGESPDQVPGADISRVASENGLAYVAIPVSHAGFSLPQVEAMAEAIGGSEGAVLAYCRSGTRSTFLWALAQAKAGIDPDEISTSAMAAGYDVTPIRPTIDMLAAGEAG
ncbi:TIGR01244 family sulfur transferase [Parerythrobacter lacustris]|uniref:TIGR01244 family sulfur transferase n=1 Tax=Parerythrobacter lacustris TaxID=2969984 RepID=A0ABT1XRJ0_9SPHN|nr:TIGR01244 family sulfur transferase [Parerythrobacter lacustris]MCR2834278.1 TIGR01244 family sulfur transferase [Parerythrobacter lacustris]